MRFMGDAVDESVARPVPFDDGADGALGRLSADSATGVGMDEGPASGSWAD